MAGHANWGRAGWTVKSERFIASGGLFTEACEQGLGQLSLQKGIIIGY